MDVHSKALESMFNDLDDMETRKMFGDKDSSGGVSITISVQPNHAEPDGDEVEGMEGDEMNKGGIVAPQEESEDLSLPPFLRKKKTV